MKKSKKRIVCKCRSLPLTKETAEERAERIRMWRTTTTRIVPNKKTTYNRNAYKNGCDINGD